MIIAGIQKLTLLDYPDHVACIIFTKACNFKCPFCQNSQLININDSEDEITEEEIFNYLNKRKGILDGVVISGGEPTVQKDLKKFIRKIKELGLEVKLDTNGYKYQVLKELIDEKLVDYIAMDIKNSLYKYETITGLKKVDIKNIEESVKILKKTNIPHEFRTTIMKEYHDINDIKDIISLIGTDSKYFLQNFKNSENVLNKSLHGFSSDELKAMEDILIKEDKNIKVRDL